MWVIVATGIVIFALYALQGIFNDWVFFVALAVVVMSVVAVLRYRKNRMASANRRD